jgi:hypothetical protein
VGGLNSILGIAEIGKASHVSMTGLYLMPATTGFTLSEVDVSRAVQSAQQAVAQVSKFRKLPEVKSRSSIG